MPKNNRLIKTEVARRYELVFKQWELKNWREIEKVRDAFKDSKALKVEFFFVFHRGRILTKSGQIKLKQNDTSNRIKIVEDMVAKAIGIDDALFVLCPLEKLWCDSESEQQVIVRFSHYDLREFKKGFMDGVRE